MAATTHFFDWAIRYRRRLSIPFLQNVVAGLIALLDALAVCVPGLVIYLFYVNSGDEKQLLYLTTVGVQTVMTVAIFSAANLYSKKSIRYPWRQTKKVVLTCTISFLLMSALAFALKISDQYSRVWAFSWWLCATCLVCLLRGFLCSILNRWVGDGRLSRNIVVVGAGPQGTALVKHLREHKDPWIKIIGIFDDRLNRVSSEVALYPVLGNVNDLIKYALTNRIDDILIALPWAAERRLLSIRKKLQVLPVRIGLSSDVIGLNFLNCTCTYYGGVPTLNILDKPLRGWSYALKTIEDYTLATMLFVITLPFMLIIAVLIKLDSPGPILFRQRRYGYKGRLIEVLKFRTMYVDQQDQNAAKLTTLNDPRVTRIGATLRRFSLDELPQLVNVLKGEMSLVGPRPHAIQAKAEGLLYQYQVHSYIARYKVKPGMTGWAQINGWRGETDTVNKIRERVEHDLFYIENWSLFLDAKVLAGTIGTLLRSENAH
jgi:Undecaprenyl-phosphate glucose phosphotransferase